MMEKNEKISVILPSFLGLYQNCAGNREARFVRAVNSFLSQEYSDKELIIISDGCDITERIYNESFKEHIEIVFIKIDKQPFFSGNVRNAGIEKSSGTIICYLDIDDFIGANHLKIVSEKIKDYDWIYYNDYLYRNKNEITEREDIHLVEVGVGTSNITHRKIEGIDWIGCDGYRHDWKFIKKLINKTSNSSKVATAEYYVCHLPGKFEDSDIK